MPVGMKQGKFDSGRATIYREKQRFDRCGQPPVSRSVHRKRGMMSGRLGSLAGHRERVSRKGILRLEEGISRSIHDFRHPCGSAAWAVRRKSDAMAREVPHWGGGYPPVFRFERAPLRRKPEELSMPLPDVAVAETPTLSKSGQTPVIPAGAAGASPAGLTSKEAQSQLEKVGPNSMPD